MFDAVISWPTFLLALLIFGFAPGAALRLIVLVFDKDDPRRYELLAEVYRVPRVERPFWVAQQLEVALFEGVGQRVVWAAAGRITYRWHLLSGVDQNRRHPDTFWIPSEDERQAVAPGDRVKIFFSFNGRGNFMGFTGERMWVYVDAVKRRRIVGTLLNEPVVIPRLWPGDTVKFKAEHIIDIDTEQIIDVDTAVDTELPADDDADQSPPSA